MKQHPRFFDNTQLKSVVQLWLVTGGLISLLVLFVPNGNCEEFSDWESPKESKLPSKPIFTEADIQKLREDRYNSFLKKLQSSNLSEDNQEQVAHALSKAYSGVPICTFSFTLDSEGTDASSSEEKATWKVLKSGGTEHESNRKWREYSDSPVSYIPENPFDLSSGEVVAENRSQMMVRFHYKPESKISKFDDEEASVVLQYDWYAELTVDIRKAAPTKLSLSLDTEARRAQAPLLNIHTAKFELSYKFNESCNYYQISSKVFHIEGSSLFSGKYLLKTVRSFEDVSCKQPVEYLLPNKNELNFLELF